MPSCVIIIIKYMKIFFIIITRGVKNIGPAEAKTAPGGRF